MTVTRMMASAISDAGDVSRAHVAAGPFDSAPASSYAIVEVVALERHYYDGIKYLPGQTYGMATAAVERNIARGLVFVPDTTPVDWWDAPGRILAAEPCTARPKRQTPTAESYRILQGCAYDPGCAAYRFHTALNEHSVHASAFVRWEDKNPHCSLRQYDGYRDLHAVRQLAHEADVLHCHVDFLLLGETRIQPRGNQLVIRHYHGSRPDGQSWVDPELDAVNRAVQVGARLTHLAEAPGMSWLHARLVACLCRPAAPGAPDRTGADRKQDARRGAGDEGDLPCRVRLVLAGLAGIGTGSGRDADAGHRW